MEKGVYESDRVSTPSSAACSALGSISPPPSQRKTVTMSCSMSGPICTGGTTGPSPWPIWPCACTGSTPFCGWPTACSAGTWRPPGDQAVIRPLGREDTARYAATLLHLGCRSGFPAAVPLAFGTEDTKGRIRAVLSYRRPALWLILATAAACLAAGLFLLGDTNGRLEGRPVDEGMVFSYGETLPLPEPLLEELLALCNRYDGDLEPMSSLSFETDTRILLSGKKDHWEIFRGDHPLLVHTTSSGGKDRESQPYRMTGQLEQAYLAWEASLEEYLWVTRPDTLYTRRAAPSRQSRRRNKCWRN